jgi:hypothetical protein
MRRWRIPNERKFRSGNFAAGFFYYEPGSSNLASVLEYPALSGQECPLYTTAVAAQPKLRGGDF